MSKHQSLLYGFAMLSGLFLLLCLYVGVYFFLSKPTQVLRVRDPFDGETLGVDAEYAYGGEVARHAFAPLEWLDRRFLPERWQFNIVISDDP